MTEPDKARPVALECSINVPKLIATLEAAAESERPSHSAHLMHMAAEALKELTAPSQTAPVEVTENGTILRSTRDLLFAPISESAPRCERIEGPCNDPDADKLTGTMCVRCAYPIVAHAGDFPDCAPSSKAEGAQYFCEAIGCPGLHASKRDMCSDFPLPSMNPAVHLADAIRVFIQVWQSPDRDMVQVRNVFGSIEHAAQRAISLLSRPAAGEWQPIETAPKDGTDVLVTWKNCDSWFVTNAFWIQSDEDGTGWWSYLLTEVSRTQLDGACEPTHWRARLAPPYSDQER